MIILNLINGLIDLESNPTGQKIVIKDYDIENDNLPPEVKKDEKGYFIETIF